MIFSLKNNRINYNFSIFLKIKLSLFKYLNNNLKEDKEI